jgi:hypothetical protein
MTDTKKRLSFDELMRMTPEEMKLWWHNGNVPPTAEPNPCSVPRCPHPARSKKKIYCSTHERRLRVYGDVMANMPIKGRSKNGQIK